MFIPWTRTKIELGIEKNREEYFFKKYSNFTLFTPKLPSLWVGGPEIYYYLSPYPTDATHQIWLRLVQ